MDINVKKLKRKCEVRGCTNTDTYAISRYKSFGGTIMCKECLKDAFDAIELMKDEPKTKPMVSAGKERPLFFYKLEDTKEDNSTKTPVVTTDSQIKTDTKPDTEPDNEADTDNSELTGDIDKNENVYETDVPAGDEKKFVCKKCSKAFKTKQGLENHMKNCIKQ